MLKDFWMSEHSDLINGQPHVSLFVTYGWGWVYNIVSMGNLKQLLCPVSQAVNHLCMKSDCSGVYCPLNKDGCSGQIYLEWFLAKDILATGSDWLPQKGHIDTKNTIFYIFIMARMFIFSRLQVYVCVHVPGTYPVPVYTPCVTDDTCQ